MNKSFLFDTNTLELFLKLKPKQVFTGVSFFTFEKCIYEYKNMTKRKLIDRDFVCRILRSAKKDESEAGIIIIKAKDSLPHINIDYLIEELSKYNLLYEFGTSLENQYSDFKTTNIFISGEDKEKYLGGIKHFYKWIRLFYNDFQITVNGTIKENNIQVITYAEMINNPNGNISMFLDESYIPSKDIEIAFAAHVSHIDYLVTKDNKFKKGLMTIGLNTFTKGISFDEFTEIIQDG
jgi:hypothetical protein